LVIVVDSISFQLPITKLPISVDESQLFLLCVIVIEMGVGSGFGEPPFRLGDAMALHS